MCSFVIFYLFIYTYFDNFFKKFLSLRSKLLEDDVLSSADSSPIDLEFKFPVKRGHFVNEDTLEALIEHSIK